MTRTWANDSGLAISAANLNAMETDITTALGVPDAALAARVVAGATATALNATFASIPSVVKVKAAPALPRRVVYSGPGLTLDQFEFYNGMAVSAGVKALYSISGGNVLYAGAGTAPNLAIAALKNQTVADGEITALVELTADAAGNYPGVVLRHTAGGYICVIIQDGATDHRVHAYAFNGGFTELTNSASPASVVNGATLWAELRVVFKGNLLWIYVNGVLVHSAGGLTIPDAYLSAGSVGVLSQETRASKWKALSFTEYDWRYIKPNAAKQLSAGTSLCSGFGLAAPLTDAYPQQFATEVQTQLGGTRMTVYNHGISGALSDAILSDLPTRIAAQTYDVATLEVGVNDAKVIGGLTPAQTLANTTKMIALLKAADIIPVLFGPPPFSSTAFAPDLTSASYAKAAEATADARRLATEQNIFFVDVVNAVNGDFSATNTSDGLHYNATGAQKVGKAGARVAVGMARV